MILTKLQEALGEIPAHRKAIDEHKKAVDEVEQQLLAMIAKLSGLPETPPLVGAGTPLIAKSIPTTRTRERDKLDDIAEILRGVGRPMHITDIAESLTQWRGKKVVRTEIEPGMNRHIAKTKTPRIAKFAPSTYGLPEWKQPSLAKSA